MRRSKQHEYRQAYNAQAVVDAAGSQLILANRVSQCASDRCELVADIAALAAALGKPEIVLADNGYATGEEVERLSSRSSASSRRRHDFRAFSLRGLDKVAGEWDLVALAYNCKRLPKLQLATVS